VTGRIGVFLDRDGTLIEDPGYLGDPRQVRLLPGAAAAVASINRAGLPVIVVSNQSGIARGVFPESAYHEVERRIDSLLADQNAAITGHFFCPHHPDLTEPCECRKPGLLLFQQAAAKFGIDLKGSWWIGDKLTDVLPAQRLGGEGILVQTGEGKKHLDAARAAGFRTAADLEEATGFLIPSSQRDRGT
jgi:D-glycero-D-manno-heptose 1,7-bisphosphate phosphatase